MGSNARSGAVDRLCDGESAVERVLAGYRRWLLVDIDWYRSDEQIDRKMPGLSTYLGHVSPESTYWYLQAVPELLELISERLELISEGLS